MTLTLMCLMKDKDEGENTEYKIQDTRVRILQPLIFLADSCVLNSAFHCFRSEQAKTLLQSVWFQIIETRCHAF